MCSECHISINPFGDVVFRDDEGREHCLDGPALILADGTVTYCHHGKIHRRGDKPAVIYPDGRIEYWVDDEYWEDDEEIG